MPLSPYQYRPTTPPTAAEVPGLIGSHNGHGRHLSGSSIYSVDSSPDSIDIHIPTPLDRSPIRQVGPTLLPKIRTQDQTLEPPNEHQIKTHRRALSQQHNPPAQPPARPSVQRSTTVPPECNPIISPASATSNFSFFASEFSALDSPVTLTPSINRKPFSGSSHYRSSSASSLDTTSLQRYAYPTYRSRPSGLSQTSSAHWAPSVAGSSTFVSPPTYARAPTTNSPSQYCLPAEMLFSSASESTLTTSSYLAQPNPAVDLVRHVNVPTHRGMHPYFWWDIRNLASWKDFTVSTIHSIPSFPELLDLPINASAFHTPSLPATSLRPETELNLHELVRDHYAAKLNSALKITQGAKRCLRMVMGRDRDGPSFVSLYPEDAPERDTATPTATIIPGQARRRARVVGIVRSYERWNSGLRKGNGNDKVRYLEGLAALQHHMRAHSTRYGFIMTETELQIVRAGTGETPFFGHLELARPIETRCSAGADKENAPEQVGEEMTAMYALWFLHMLAKEEPLPGQAVWRMNVGLPGAMTRKIVFSEKDAWIPAPGIGEKREAKRKRGWVFPSDPWCRRREGGGRRGQ